MFKTRLLRVVLAGVVVGAATLSSFANSIDLHVALIETRPVEVFLFLPKDGRTAGFVGVLTGGLGGAFYGLAVEARNKQFGDELAAGLDPSWNRIEPLQAAIESAFATRARATKLSFSTNSELLIDSEPNFAEIAKTGSPFVLLLEPSAAYKTANYGEGSVVPGIQAKAKLVDARAKKVIWRGFLSAGHGPQLHWRDAIADASPLVANYPSACPAFADALYSIMLQQDAFHRMAANSGVGELYPEIKKLLKKEARSFTFTRKMPKGWKSLPIGNRFLFVASPDAKDPQLAIRTEIELLIPELDQDFGSIEEYIDHRLASLGASERISLESAGIALPALDDQWTSYVIQDATGMALTLHRKEGRFAITHILAATGEAPNQTLADAVPIFQRYIDTSRFKGAPRK